MGIVRTFLRDHGYLHRSELPRTGHRTYAAAQMGRLTADWLVTQASIDYDIRSGMIPVRNRARDLSQNNEYAKAYLRAVKKNVVGSEGFTLQVKSVDYKTGPNGKTMPVLDDLANSILEDAFWKWSQPEMTTVTGEMSFRKVQEIAMETVARDGEAFVYIVRGRSVNPYGFALQFIEPDYIWHQYNETLQNGNYVRMGIEVDKRRKPVAYYISQKQNNILDLYGTLMPLGPYTRVPASDMIHVFDPERIDQTRGISWMAPAMLGLHDLKGYIEAAIINARIGASKMGFLQDPTGTEGTYNGEGVDSEGHKEVEVVPGTIEDIGRRTFAAFDPKYPDNQFDPFVKTILRGISSALGVAVVSLSNDLSDTNYSSIRAGLLEERETWKSIQSLFIEKFLNRVYSEWLTMALMTGIVNLPFAKYNKFNAPRWRGRRWAWVDPLKDAEANRAAIGSGLKSSTQVINEMGGELEEVYQEISQETQLAQKYGLVFDFSVTGKGTTKDNPEVTANTTEQPTASAPTKGNGKGAGANA